MWIDSIVEETRRYREAYSASFDFDLEAIVRDLRTKEQQGGRRVVALKSKPTRRRAKPRSPRIGRGA